MTDPPVPLEGATLVIGPIGTGKTRLTAAALERWLEHFGPEGVVVLDCAPEIETDDGLIGGRLDRVVDVPASVHYAAIEAAGPRTEGDTSAAISELAAANAERALAALEAAPTAPVAVFGNDVTIAAQHDPTDIDALLSYCDTADCSVLNAYVGDTFDAADPISMNERVAVDRLRSWADRVVDLTPEA